MQAALYRRVVEDPNAVFQQYDAFKRNFKQTHQACHDQNLRFTPMVVEAHGGGWSPTFRRVVDWLARNAAVCSHEDAAAVSFKIAQRISYSLQRENLRAILKRQGQPTQERMMSAWVSAADGSVW